MGHIGHTKEGILIYDQQQERYDIRYDIEDYYGGLHCGTCFDVFFRDKWISTRIEYSWEKSEWYLVGISRDGSQLQLDGLKVRLDT